MLDVSIIIVNYNTAKLTHRCVTSILASKPTCSFEIVIIDNASNDHSKDFFSTLPASVVFYQNNRNEGFARGVNLGYQKAIGKNLLILNPDTYFKTNILDTFLQKSIDSSNKFLVQTCRLRNDDGSYQKSSYSQNASFKELLSYNIIFDYLNQKNTTKDNTIKALNGACLFLSRSTFDELKGFDEDFFLYSEEFEFCHRILKKHGELFVNEANEIFHISEASSESKKWNHRQRLASIGLLFYKVHGTFGFYIFFSLLWINAFTNFFFLWKMDKAARINFWNSSKNMFLNTMIFYRILFCVYPKPLMI